SLQRILPFKTMQVLVLDRPLLWNRTEIRPDIIIAALWDSRMFYLLRRRIAGSFTKIVILKAQLILFLALPPFGLNIAIFIARKTHTSLQLLRLRIMNSDMSLMIAF